MASLRKNATARRPARDDDFHVEFANLQDRPHHELKLLWVETFKSAAPRNLSRRLMIHALAHQIQARAYGGLNKSVQRELLDRAEMSLGQSNTGSRSVPPVTLSSGTRLMREWHGVVHVVDRTTDGFLWNGRTFRSLSAIARAITGARWNGLAFFGLRKKQANAQKLAVNSTDTAREIAA